MALASCERGDTPSCDGVPFPCAGYIGYPFEESRDYASKIPLSHCHDEEIDALARKIENRQANVQPIFTQLPRQPSRGLRRSPRFQERKQDRERTALDTAHPITPSLLHSRLWPFLEKKRRR